MASGAAVFLEIFFRFENTFAPWSRTPIHHFVPVYQLVQRKVVVFLQVFCRNVFLQILNVYDLIAAFHWALNFQPLDFYLGLEVLDKAVSVENVTAIDRTSLLQRYLFAADRAFESYFLFVYLRATSHDVGLFLEIFFLQERRIQG